MQELRPENAAAPIPLRVSVTHQLCGDPPEGRSALDQRRLGNGNDGKSAISLSGSLRARQADRPRIYG